MLLIRLSGLADVLTAVNSRCSEVLHHAEEFLPENIKSSIIKAWQNDLIRAFKSAENGSNRKTMLHAIIHSIAMGDMSAIEKAINSMDGVIPSNTYHLFNPQSIGLKMPHA